MGHPQVAAPSHAVGVSDVRSPIKADPPGESSKAEEAGKASDAGDDDHKL